MPSPSLVPVTCDVPDVAPLRCATQAALRGDPLIGTGFPAARLLLVEQPGSWGRAGFTQSRLDARVAAELDARCRRAGLRVQAIRRPGRADPGATRRWAVADTRDGRSCLVCGDYTVDAELLELDLDAPAGVPDPDPLFLVCTHSKHDVCCALQGRPVAAALEAERPGRVWETSHLGGDRFAANVLVLTSGLLYGRVTPQDAGDVVRSADAGTVLVENLRGRIGLPPPVQAALAFGHRHLGVLLRDALRVDAVRTLPGDVTEVELSGPDGALGVLVRAERRPVQGLTCTNTGPGEYLGYVASVA